jgi:hypothetical protein
MAVRVGTLVVYIPFLYPKKRKNRFFSNGTLELDSTLLISAMLGLVKCVFQKINDLGVCPHPPSPCSSVFSTPQHTRRSDHLVLVIQDDRRHLLQHLHYNVQVLQHILHGVVYYQLQCYVR